MSGRRLERLPAGAVGAVETLVLGIAAAALVLVVFPRAFGIESSCLGAAGVQMTAGDTYIGGFVALGTIGWLGVFLGILYAGITERRGLVMVLPLVWFLALVGTALVAAAVVGPTPCPS